MPWYLLTRRPAMDLADSGAEQELREIAAESRTRPFEG
jgi:hypothetical protein